MPKKPKIDPAELDIFYQTMKGVKPLKQKKIRLSPPPPQRRKIIMPHHEIDPVPFYFHESSNVETVGSETFIVYKQASISNKILRKLRKGQYNVDAILDLHGMSIEEAKIAIEQFLQEGLRAGVRVALIIHGKGHHSQMPILKNKINHWLREIGVVLAFCSALPTHGSRGATYVLLKRVK